MLTTVQRSSYRLPDLSLAPPGKGMAFVFIPICYASGIYWNEDVLYSPITVRLSTIPAGMWFRRSGFFVEWELRPLPNRDRHRNIGRVRR